MTISGELSAPAMRAAWQKLPPEPAWRQICGILWSSDLFVIVAMSALGLVASICAAFFWPSFLE
jgi:hypothetical protein